MELKHMRHMVQAALIFHNMGVSDRVMDGNVYAVCDPTNSILDSMDKERVVQPDDLATRQRGKPPRHTPCFDTLVWRQKDVYQLVAGPSGWGRSR